MSWTSNAVISKARSIYGNCLKESDYLELLKKRTVSEIANFLKTKPNYQEKLKNISESNAHRGHLEFLLKENLFDQSIRLIKFVHLKDKSFYALNLIKLENELVLTTIRTIMSEDEEEAFTSIPLYFDKYTKIDIKSLAQAKTLHQVLDALKKTNQYDLLTPFLIKKELRSLEYLDIEHVLEEYYYRESIKVINKYYSGKTKKELMNIFSTRIEISNIIKIYRLKRFYKAPKEIISKNLVSIYSRISKTKMEEIIALDDEKEILGYLKNSEYNKYIDNKEYVYIEYFGEKIKYNLAKKYLYFSNEAPLVFQAFIMLNDLEVDNLVNIIEGIRYQISEGEIKTMLIY